MQKIRLLTKFEVVLAVFFLLVIAVISVTSVNRTINNSSDTIETFIRNTKGNIWDPTGVNLQAAINDLNGQGGTVWIGSDITLSSEITVNNIGIDGSCTILDFQGNAVTLASSAISVINLTNACHVTVENVVIKPDPQQTASIIKFYVGPTGGPVSYNTFDNVYVKNQGPWVQSVWGLMVWANHNFTVIDMTLNGPGEINQNTFRCISADGPRRGIYLNQLTNTGWINGTYVDDFWLNQYQECIRFKRYPNNNHSFNDNTFSAVKVQTGVFTQYGITNISGFGNHFEHCLMWDFYVCMSGHGYSSSGVEEYSISADADSTYMQLHEWTGIASGYCKNNGKNTMVIANGKVQVGG